MFSLQDLLCVPSFVLQLHLTRVTYVCSVAQDSVNALYIKCLQHLLRDSHLVSSRTFKRELQFAHFRSKLFNRTYFSCLLENACQARSPDEPDEAGSRGERPGQCGERRQQCPGLSVLPLPSPAHTLSCDPLISQMYVQHDIYDLIFKYVGTMEASEVSSKSSSTRMKALFIAF